MKEFDLFISFSTKDVEFTKPLLEELKKRGIKTWCSLDQLREQPSHLYKDINKGIVSSEYGLAIISKNYLDSTYPTDEYAAMYEKESGSLRKIIHIWLNVTKEDINKKFPMMVNGFALNADLPDLPDLICNQIHKLKIAESNEQDSIPENREKSSHFSITEQLAEKKKRSFIPDKYKKKLKRWSVAVLLAFVEDFQLKSFSFIKLTIGVFFITSASASFYLFYNPEDRSVEAKIKLEPTIINDTTKESNFSRSAYFPENQKIASLDSTKITNQLNTTDYQLHSLDSDYQKILNLFFDSLEIISIQKSIGDSGNRDVSNYLIDYANNRVLTKQYFDALNAYSVADSLFPLMSTKNEILVTKKLYSTSDMFFPEPYFFRMVFVEAGTFTMGSEESKADKDESPRHKVNISQNYWIGQEEVSQFLYNKIMGANNSKSMYDQPADSITWENAQIFIKKLNTQIKGMKFRLPTEAEWEFAARGGIKSRGFRFSGSNNIDIVGCYINNFGGGFSRPYALKQNELWIYNMSGNVWEWCEDWYGAYSSQTQTDPAGPEFGAFRVSRGGCVSSKANDCRVSNRNEKPQGGYKNSGFRLAGTIEY